MGLVSTGDPFQSGAPSASPHRPPPVQEHTRVLVHGVGRLGPAPEGEEVVGHIKGLVAQPWINNHPWLSHYHARLFYPRFSYRVPFFRPF
jgi:hypothetical protein